MNALVFLALAAGASIVGTIVLWARHRETDSPEASVEEFSAKMRALSDDSSLHYSDLGRPGWGAGTDGPGAAPGLPDTDRGD